MPVTLLRHTRPAVAKGICYGQTDMALADSFEAELTQVLSNLPDITGVQSSPLARCARLAERISLHSKHEVRFSNNWKEMNFNSWEAAPWSAIPRDELDGWAADFMGYRGHGGESVRQLYQRIETGLSTVADGTLIVTHAGVIKAALAVSGAADPWNASPDFGAFVTL